jgi:hypothetical protein
MSPGSSDMPEFSVNFKCQWHEWNDLAVLQDFNYVMRGAGYYGCPVESNNNLTNSAKQYFSLASITKANSPSLHADPNMIGGGIISENRALVQYADLRNNERSSENKFKPSTTLLRPYKYILTFDSAKDFSTFNKAGEEQPIEANDYSTFVHQRETRFNTDGLLKNTLSNVYGQGNSLEPEETRTAVGEANTGVVTDYGESNGYSGTNYNVNF